MKYISVIKESEEIAFHVDLFLGIYFIIHYTLVLHKETNKREPETIFVVPALQINVTSNAPPKYWKGSARFPSIALFCGALFFQK